MFNNYVEKQCVLCGKTVDSKETERGNRTRFVCDNPECGDLEVSWRAISWLDKNPQSKPHYQSEAKSCKAEGKVLEIIFNNGEIRLSRI